MTTGQPTARRKAGFLETIKAVGWSFFGVRGRKGHERDLARLHPLHVILAGLLMAAVFVLTLVVIVRVVAA
ncbi:MAG: DUF2970 domain-containing protein [Burkholderiaceae bacterium]|nr:DUF2970 domain-containing protein [Burkholderiaceae bacterium]